MIVIQAHALSCQLPTQTGSLTILSNLNLTIEAAETLAIVGASGSGKSTLLALLAGLDVPTSGFVTLAGVNLSALSEEQRAAIRREKIGFVFQSFLLIPSLTALENVMLPAELAGSAKAREQAEALLARVGLTERAHHYPNQLSGGEQQRVAIARAFIGQPAILFADEPTGNLDRQTGLQIEALLFELNRNFGTTLVLVTHDEQLAQQCQRMVRLEQGQLVEQSYHAP